MSDLKRIGGQYGKNSGIDWNNRKTLVPATTEDDFGWETSGEIQPQVLQLEPTGVSAISGLVAPSDIDTTAEFDAVYVSVWNNSAFTVTLNDQEAGSVITNRFSLPTNGDYSLLANASVTLAYRVPEQRWFIVG